MRFKLSFAILAVTLLVSSSWATTEQALYSFNNTDGGLPASGVIFDAAGNLYGMTPYGGNENCTGGCGTVFELTPAAGGRWTHKVLHFFSNSADGHYPYASLVLDGSGNLYGTTAFGGSGSCKGGCGTVFELTPKTSGTWAEKVLHSFNGKDGRYAEAALIFDAFGNLYGSTSVGGTHGYGTVFELVHNANGGWTAEVLHDFEGGYGSLGSLVFDGSGNLYGTTLGGGAFNDGTVFKLKANGTGGWTETVLHSFNGNDGSQPFAGLILKKGAFYGTTLSGGANGGGTVFKLAPKAGGGWTEKVLYSFCASALQFCPNGSGPEAGLTFGATGRLYGTTASGGSQQCEVGCGTAFELTPSRGGGWNENVLYLFGVKSTDGIVPVANLAIDSSGNLFGTTHDGGVGGYGIVFEITLGLGN